ncbi:MAG: thioesterase family protein [Candidatus Dormibacteraceae bacterium]
MAAFLNSIALRREGDRFQVAVPDAWRVEGAANGGFVAATLLGAMQERLARPDQPPRSLSIHFLRPLLPGSASISVEVERSGRRLSTVSAAYAQGGRTTALATASLGSALAAELIEQTLVMPESPPPEGIPPTAIDFGAPFGVFWDYRLTVGSAPYSGSPATAIGGWVRTRDVAPVDARVMAAMADCFPPAVLSRLDRRVGLVPTIDLTVHFRRALPWPAVMPGDFCFALFETRTVADGYLEEDGAIWAADGTLLAQSRQLAILG